MYVSTLSESRPGLGGGCLLEARRGGIGTGSGSATEGGAGLRERDEEVEGAVEETDLREA